MQASSPVKMKKVTIFVVISLKILFSCFPSNTGEPSRSMFDAQGLLFGLRSRHYCGNTIISFVLLSVGTIWAAKHRTKVHHWAKTSRLPSTWSLDTYDLFWCLSSTSRNHVTWRHFWNGSISAGAGEVKLRCYCSVGSQADVVVIYHASHLKKRCL